MQKKGRGELLFHLYCEDILCTIILGTEPINSAWQLFQRFISVYMANTEAYIYIQYTELPRTEDKEVEQKYKMFQMNTC